MLHRHTFCAPTFDPLDTLPHAIQQLSLLDIFLHPTELPFVNNAISILQLQDDKVTTLSYPSPQHLCCLIFSITTTNHTHSSTPHIETSLSPSITSTTPSHLHFITQQHTLKSHKTPIKQYQDRHPTMAHPPLHPTQSHKAATQFRRLRETSCHSIITSPTSTSWTFSN